jgi:hypothetical protein
MSRNTRLTSSRSSYWRVCASCANGSLRQGSGKTGVVEPFGIRRRATGGVRGPSRCRRIWWRCRGGVKGLAEEDWSAAVCDRGGDGETADEGTGIGAVRLVMGQ